MNNHNTEQRRRLQSKLSHAARAAWLIPSDGRTEASLNAKSQEEPAEIAVNVRKFVNSAICKDVQECIEKKAVTF